MTDQKKLKRAVRARSQKTGESYTAARRQVLQAKAKKAEPAQTAPTPPKTAVVEPPSPAARPKVAKRAAPRGQVNDDAARKQTGHGLDHWFAVLDAFEAGVKGHTAAARHLNKDHGIPSWYSQGITVAYERERGLRQVHQSSTGDFQVSVTKTLPASLEEVLAAVSDAQRRAVWLAKADRALRQALDAAFLGPRPKEVRVKGMTSARLSYRWGASTVEMGFLVKPTGTTLAVANTKLRGPEEVEGRRALWKAALAGLLRHLAG